jgi:O-antigen chain-terminating methyltransferase
MPDPLQRSLPDDDVLYQWGTEELTAQVQRRFVSYFTNVPGKVLEIGCGKGVMLSMLKEKGVAAYGIDLSDTTVEYCRSKGLDALKSDALGHLRSVGSESLGGIFCAHVIEHLQPADAVELLRESYRVLQPGGRLLLITPNAKDIRTAERFWLDMTHVRPYPAKLLRFLLKREGFRSVRSFHDREPARNFLERMAKTFLRMWFMGYMFTGDLVVVADK